MLFLVTLCLIMAFQSCMDWIPTKKKLFIKTTCSWSFIHSHFFCKILNAVCADYFIIFQYLLTFFFATFFQNQTSKDHLTQGNLLKTTLFYEKQSNLEKEMYGNISYCQYFSPGTGIKNMKNYYILSSRIKQAIK